MEKVKLPKEVAEAIEYLRSKGETTADIVSNCFGNANAKPYLTIKGFWDTHQDFERLLKALVNGYEVEQTPEEKVKKAYDSFLDIDMTPLDYGAKEHSWYQAGMRVALHLLGYKIEGVTHDPR